MPKCYLDFIFASAPQLSSGSLLLLMAISKDVSLKSEPKWPWRITCKKKKKKSKETSQSEHLHEKGKAA